MPEGDTIWRAAATLDRALAGHRLRRFDAPRLVHRPFPPGTHVEGVSATGKHCLVRFDDGRVLRTHMRMTGAWHLYRPGERWRRSPSAMRALVEVDDWVAVCFSAPVVELSAANDVAVAHLGPDLCAEPPDLDEVLRRLAAEPAGRPVLDALLDQRIACGIGNVYKSEALFACGVHPCTPLGQLSTDSRRHLWATAAEQLRANLGGGARDTTGGDGLAVYGRRGRPCPRCGSTVEWDALGEHHRGTSWCPVCQPSVPAVDSRPGAAG